MALGLLKRGELFSPPLVASIPVNSDPTVPTLTFCTLSPLGPMSRDRSLSPGKRDNEGSVSLLVRNVPFSVSPDDLKQDFSHYGEVSAHFLGLCLNVIELFFAMLCSYIDPHQPPRHHLVQLKVRDVYMPKDFNTGYAVLFTRSSKDGPDSRVTGASLNVPEQGGEGPREEDSNTHNSTI